jgi:hypothetical protein
LSQSHWSCYSTHLSFVEYISFVTGSAFVEEDFCGSVAVEEVTAAEER